ncbi:nucleoid-associated protein [Streptomyces sp. cf386]|uniref:nucleoid-associated protein n=1 Tax=Streptomyces sp. cf386 TaxID=1761904 RepID=UPI0015A4352D|nr:nucleoid-associated protein [Streptomyces sp. cf386]
MSGEFAQLVVDEAIFHLVPQRKRSDPVPAQLKLSEAVCQLGEDVRGKIQANFRGVLTKHGRPVVEELEVKKSTVPDRIYEYLAQQRELVDVSVDLAELLFESQKGRSPAGLLLVAAARLAGKRALLIVKLEQEGGLRAEDVLVEGKRTFDMSYFADLLMTEHNKIYKAALFCVDGVPEDGPIEGWAADKQLAGKMAQFWLQAFLGCRQKEDPKRLTQEFHEAAVDWVDKRVDDPEKSVDYLMAVLVELRSNTATLDPTAFAADHLDLHDQDNFLTYLASKDVPTTVFDKDIERVAPRLSELQIGFASGISIVAPVRRVREDIKIDEHPDGTSTVTVRGKITSTRSHYSARKPDAPQTDGQAPRADSTG